MLDDLIEERLVVINPVTSLNPGESYSLSIRFFNNVGAEEVIPVNYNSSEESVATINPAGVITTLAEGQTTPPETALSYFDMVPTSWGISATDPYPKAIVSAEAGRKRALDAYEARGF